MKRMGMKKTAGLLWAAAMALIVVSAGPAFAGETGGGVMRAAAVQFQPRGSAEANTGAILEKLRGCAELGARVAVFQECAVTGYDKAVIAETTEEQLLRAEDRIAAACDELNLYAVVGTPHFKDGDLYNTAVVFGPGGETVARYAKMQLVGGDSWARPGGELLVFPVDGVPCSIIVCHDERYPELTRLQVLAGARVVFYVSSESDVTHERKLEPYRAQIRARADENDIFIVHANSPAMESHGQSRIIGPDGNLLGEATMFQDEIVFAELDLRRATRETALRSLRADLLREWWEKGVSMVRVMQ